MTTMFTALAALLSTSAFALDSFDTFLEPLGYVDGGMERDAELADLEACELEAGAVSTYAADARDLLEPLGCREGRDAVWDCTESLGMYVPVGEDGTLHFIEKVNATYEERRQLFTVNPEELYGPDNAGACASYDIVIDHAVVQRDGSIDVDGLLVDTEGYAMDGAIPLQLWM